LEQIIDTGSWFKSSRWMAVYTYCSARLGNYPVANSPPVHK